MTQRTITYDDATHAVVPKEPASEMLQRAVVLALNVRVSSDYDWPQYMRDLWAELLAAAPKPEAVSRMVPSDDDIERLWRECNGPYCASLVFADNFARALLSRYGSRHE